MKSIKKFKTINQVSTILKLPQHVLRFWENKFIQLKPLKLSGNRRYYRDIDVELIIYIKNLLHEDCITIKGVQKIFKNLTINQILKNLLTTLVIKRKIQSILFNYFVVFRRYLEPKGNPGGIRRDHAETLWAAFFDKRAKGFMDPGRTRIGIRMVRSGWHLRHHRCTRL